MTGRPLESRRGVSLNRGRHDGPSAWGGPSARRGAVLMGRLVGTQHQLEEKVS